MDKDLDKLLEEFSTSSAIKNKDELTEDISDLLEVTVSNDLMDSSTKKKSIVDNSISDSSSIDQTKKKCFPLFLSGSTFAQGLGSTALKRSCNNLMCISCDFKVKSFDNLKWHPSTDYLFLRNNMPDFSRLRSKLVKAPGFRAYACQCQFKSLSNLERIDSTRELKWICLTHS